MKRKTLVVLVFAAGMSYAKAGVPDFVTYSGRLTDGTAWGQSTTLDLTFRVYGSADGDDLLWQGEYPGLAVEDGYFSVMLTGVTDVFGAHDETWITLCVNQGCTPEDDLMPRQKIGSVPYAVRADNTAEADQAKGAAVFHVMDSAGIGSPPIENVTLVVGGPVKFGETMFATMNLGNCACGENAKIEASVVLSYYTNYVRVEAISGLCDGTAALVEKVWSSYFSSGTVGATKVTTVAQYGPLDVGFSAVGQELKISVDCITADGMCYNIKLLITATGVESIGPP